MKGVSGVWKDLTDSVNQMAGNLSAQMRNIAEVTLGADERLGGQAVVAGTWTDSVNAMATNLTAQVRNIATVTSSMDSPRK